MFLKSILIILCFSSCFSRFIKALRYINRWERAFVRGISGVLFCFAFLFLHVCIWQSGIWLMILFYTYHLCPSCLLQFYAQWPGRLICAYGTDLFTRVWLGRGMGRIRRGSRVYALLFTFCQPFLLCCQAGWGCVPLFFPFTQRDVSGFLFKVLGVSPSFDGPLALSPPW